MKETICDVWYFIFRLFIRIFCRRRRQRRIKDIRCYIMSIRDSHGCGEEQAMKIYKEIERISKHYTIPPSEVGFQGDDWTDLYVEIGRSIRRNERYIHWVNWMKKVIRGRRKSSELVIAPV